MLDAPGRIQQPASNVHWWLVDVDPGELMRKALKFFGKHKMLFDLCDDMTVYTYSELLSSGEHMILDINHWMLFMSFMETHPDKEKFWRLHREICRAHA